MPSRQTTKEATSKVKVKITPKVRAIKYTDMNLKNIPPMNMPDASHTKNILFTLTDKWVKTKFGGKGSRAPIERKGERAGLNSSGFPSVPHETMDKTLEELGRLHMSLLFPVGLDAKDRKLLDKNVSGLMNAMISAAFEQLHIGDKRLELPELSLLTLACVSMAAAHTELALRM